MLQTYEKGNNDNLDQYLSMNPSQSCLQNQPWKCPRRRLTVWKANTVCGKDWHANHSELYPKVLSSVDKNASNEMSEYLHDKIRKRTM